MLSIDKVFNPLGNVNVFSSTHVKLHRAMPPWLRVVLLADRKSGFAVINFTNNFASRNLKVVFESAVLIIK